MEKDISLNDEGKLEEALNFESEIHYPISFQNVNTIIPPDHHILYSTLCKTQTSSMMGNKRVTRYFSCHAIFTDHGLAINKPISFYSSSNQAILRYYPWHLITLKKKGFEIDEIIGGEKASPIFRLQRWKGSETKKEFKERKGRFLEKLWSPSMDKKSKMENLIYKVLMANPELRKIKNFKKSKPPALSFKLYYRVLRKVKRS